MTRTCPRITETITYKRRKKVGRKQNILDSLPGEEVHYQLDDLTCPDCRHELKEIGSFCARQELLKLEVNETPYRVLDSERAKDYVWTFLSGKHTEKPIILYHHGSRKGAEAWNFLTGFSGYLHCDQYPGYLRLSQQDVTLVGCMAHARRKFFDSLPKNKAIGSDATSVARQGIHYCDQMFSFERSWKDLSAEERYKKRQSELKTLLKKFSDWCYKKSVSVLPSGKLGGAFQYCLNHMDKFMNILKDGRLELSNNRAERAVKEIVMGRKNWLFSQSSTGAKAMAIIMSILKTAKQNGLDQFKYINYLLDKLPNEPSLLDNQRLEVYLPWSENFQLKVP